MPEPFRQALAEAEPLWKAGEPERAMALLEALPGIDQVEPAVLEIKVLLSRDLGRWEEGKELPYLLELADDDNYKMTSAEFYWAYARHLCGEGEVADGEDPHQGGGEGVARAAGADAGGPWAGAGAVRDVRREELWCAL